MGLHTHHATGLPPLCMGLHTHHATGLPPSCMALQPSYQRPAPVMHGLTAIIPEAYPVMHGPTAIMPKAVSVALLAAGIFLWG